MTPVALLVLAAALPIAAVPVSTPARAFAPAILDSVVSVLPEWPEAEALPEAPEGSAVAVFAGGYLATNAHVIGRARRLRVRLADGRLLPAELIGADPPTDIALIRVEIDLPLLETAPPPPLGAPVCAVGNQFGLGLSVTCGVVSARHRTNAGFNPIEDFIQTDAAVNPGGSGGALVDGDGRLVGLVSAIFTKQSDANIGVNFATSMRLVMRVVEDLKSHGRVRRGRLGLRVADLGDAARARLAGARVVEVGSGTAADTAGIAAGDVIVAVDDRTVHRASDVASAVQSFRIGEAFTVDYVRDGVRHGVSVTLGP